MKMSAAILAVVALAGVALAQDDVLKLKNQIIDIQNKGEFGLQNFALCSEITGYGIYVPLKESVMPKTGQLLIYIEPRNTFIARKAGQYEFWFSLDMAVLSETGEVLQEMKDVQPMHYTTKVPVLDIDVQPTLSLEGAPPGKYKVRVTLHDKLRTASVTHEADIRVK